MEDGPVRDDATGPGLDPALRDVAHPTEAERIRRGALLGTALGVLLLVLGRRPASADR